MISNNKKMSKNKNQKQDHDDNDVMHQSMQESVETTTTKRMAITMTYLDGGERQDSR